MNENNHLHFDVSRGCTAEILISALIDLKGDLSVVKKGLVACGVLDIEPVSKQGYFKNTSQSFIDFENEFGKSITTPLSRRLNSETNLPKISKKKKPAWDRKNKIEDERDVKDSKNQPFSTSIRVDTLDSIRKVLTRSTLDPVSKALAIKTIDLLIDALKRCTRNEKADFFHFNETEATRILCETIAFCQLIWSLDLSSVSASRIAYSAPILNLEDPVDREGWLLALSENVPTFHRTWPAPYSEPIGLALLLAITGRFGDRGESTVLRYGSGTNALKNGPDLIARALLCAPTPIASRPNTAPFGINAPALAFVELSATLGAGIDVPALLKRLKILGMKSVQTWQGFEGSSFPKFILRGFVSQPDLDKALKALLVTGEATQVYTRNVEQHALQNRIVAVPLGRNQSQKACKVIEWLWEGNIVRAEPDLNDLAMLVKSSGYAQDVIRSDILAAWRRWREPTTN